MESLGKIKIDESILEQFGINPVVPVITNGMKLSDIIEYMSKAAQKIVSKRDAYLATDDESEKDDCLDIASERLNQFSQAFMDIIKFIKIKESAPLSKEEGLIKCMRTYKIMNDTMSSEEENFLNSLSLRNDLTHDYFNYIVHKENLATLLVNYADGAMETCEFLKNYCSKKGFMEDIVNKEDVRRE